MFSKFGKEPFNPQAGISQSNYDVWTQDPTQLIGSAAHKLL
jgi:hypothetical protein